MRYQVLFLMPALLFASAATAEELPRALKPVIVWTGTYSKEADQSFARCCSQREWETCWNKHIAIDEKADKQPCPEIDFDSYMTIVFFKGQSDHGLTINSILEEKDCIRVRYRPNSYQTGELRPGEPVGRAQNYSFIVFAKSKKPVVLEEDVHFLIGDPPVWKQQAKLPAVDDK